MLTVQLGYACVRVCVICVRCVGAPHTATAHLPSDEAGPPFNAASNRTQRADEQLGYARVRVCVICVRCVGTLHTATAHLPSDEPLLTLRPTAPTRCFALPLLARPLALLSS